MCVCERERERECACVRERVCVCVYETTFVIIFIRNYNLNTICQVKSSHLYLYSAFNNTNCNKALHNIKIGKFVNNVK